MNLVRCQTLCYVLHDPRVCACVRAWVCMPWIHQLLLVCFLQNKIHTFESITEPKCVYVTSNISCTYLPNETETNVLVTSYISCTYLPNETETKVLVTSNISCTYLPNETETNVLVTSNISWLYLPAQRDREQRFQ